MKFLAAAAFAAAAVCPTALAGTPVWTVNPVYNSLGQLSDKLYIGRLGKSAIVINGSDGSAVTRVPDIDSITPVCEGMSLLLDKEADNKGNDRLRLAAIVDADGKVKKMSQPLFVNDYAYFSDGMCPVYDKDNLYGYIDTSGKLAVQCSYINIHPFRDGFASVTKRKRGFLGKIGNSIQDGFNSIAKRRPKVEYINKTGETLKLSKNIGGIVVGSSFDNGRAYVETDKGTIYIINTKGERVNLPGNDIDLEFDENYVVVRGNEEGKEAPAPESAFGIVPFEENDLFGYRNAAGKVIIPVQFNDALPFNGKYAPAERKGKWGILSLVPQNVTVDVTQPAAKQTKSRKGKKSAAAQPQSPTITCETTVPDLYADTKLSMSLTPSTGASTVRDSEPGTKRSFSFDRPSGSYKLALYSPILTIWEETREATQIKTTESKAHTSGGGVYSLRITATPSAKADKNDNAAVAVVFTNPTSEAISFTANISGQQLSPVSKTLTVPARSSRTVYTKFTKVTTSGKRAISIKANGRTTTKTVSLTPFFIAL